MIKKMCLFLDASMRIHGLQASMIAIICIILKIDTIKKPISLLVFSFY